MPIPHCYNAARLRQDQFLWSAIHMSLGHDLILEVSVGWKWSGHLNPYSQVSPLIF